MQMQRERVFGDKEYNITTEALEKLIRSRTLRNTYPNILGMTMLYTCLDVLENERVLKMINSMKSSYILESSCKIKSHGKKNIPKKAEIKVCPYDVTKVVT